MATRKHRRHDIGFIATGGDLQAEIRSGEDLVALAGLEISRWVTWACPVDVPHVDRTTLNLLDADGDGFINATDVVEVLHHVKEAVARPELLKDNPGSLTLADLNPETELGEKHLESAARILKLLGKERTDALSVAELDDLTASFHQEPCNGDGIITESSTDDPDLQRWISFLITQYGATQDSSGLPGISLDQVRSHAATVRAWHEWQDGCDFLHCLPRDKEMVLLLWHNVREKLEDFFLRCQVAQYDDRGAALMNSPEHDLVQLGSGSLSEAAEQLAHLPLSRVDAAAILSLESGLNPAWKSRIRQFREHIVVPLLGERQELTLAQWEELKERMFFWENWWRDRPESADGMDPVLLAEWENGGVEAALAGLIDRDLARKPEADALQMMTALLRYSRDLYHVARNFVSFGALYGARKEPTFCAGTLFVDGRRFDLCLPVSHVKAHAERSQEGNLFLLYCACSKPGVKENRAVVAVVTDGVCGNLHVGLNGVFVAADGEEWQATVTQTVGTPVRLRDAFFAPYLRSARLFYGYLQQPAGGRPGKQKERAEGNGQAREGKSGIREPGGATIFAAATGLKMVASRLGGRVAAVGLSLGAISTGVFGEVKFWDRLSPWQLALLAVAPFILISLTSFLMAWLKVNSQSLAPVLEASGWDINPAMKLKPPKRHLTQKARMPRHSAFRHKQGQQRQPALQPD
ncbi:hypothetical protein M1B72_11070 [Geomonas paludis]|uniref:EF-hand domain-containing protein n=1 Tax=Geomonas paludis TaxID=2740185 RepID=A0A6V8MTN0_9BACT|nr:hypothetical protein [Geomonas paludis]UPU38224.1 hypothetical protein M1B72_11070 [Geomonas paludis]GFO63244.1 hypothetical protein GMPD_11630 [Geomonas paludis]